MILHGNQIYIVIHDQGTEMTHEQWGDVYVYQWISHFYVIQSFGSVLIIILLPRHTEVIFKQPSNIIFVRDTAI